MLSHPHATETKGGTRAGHYVAFRLRHIRGAVKEGTCLGQAPTGQDSFGPCDFQCGHWPREGRRIVQLNSLTEQCSGWLKAVHHLQRCGCVASYVHGDKGVCH